jgi:hypothetical protein
MAPDPNKILVMDGKPSHSPAMRTANPRVRALSDRVDVQRRLTGVVCGTVGFISRLGMSQPATRLGS